MVAVFAVAQTPASKNAVTNDFLQKQFGNTCKLLDGPTPIVADLDGDGTDDLAVAARCTNPMIDQAEHNYVVIDPYYSFFGYGNPKVSSEFASEDPDRRGVVLLIVHGSGAEAWRADQPKAKFMIINLPFKQLMARKLKLRKKLVVAIYADEGGADRATSATFWDGKKYRYQPMGSSME
jgi:hypothetical protein